MPDGPVGCKSRLMKYLETWYWYRRSFFSKKPLKSGPWLPAGSLDRNAPRVVLLRLTREDPSTQHLSYYGGPLAGFLQPWAPLIKPSTVSWLVLYPDELDCILDNIDVVMRPGSILKHSRASDDINIDQWSDLELEYEVSSMIGKTSEQAVLTPAQPMDPHSKVEQNQQAAAVPLPSAGWVPSSLHSHHAPSSTSS